MADFDAEQMRILLQNLAEKLNNTKGDDNIIEKLKAVEKAIQDFDKRSASSDKKTKADEKKENAEFLNELAKTLENLSTLKNIEKAIHENGVNNSGPGQSRLNLDPEEFGGLGKGIGKMAGKAAKFASILDNVSSGTLKFAQNFTQMDGSFRGFINAVGLGNTAFAGMAFFADQRTDAFKQLLNSAEGTIGSLEDMSKAMNESTMSAQELADAMSKGSQGARLMGASQFGKVYNALKEQTLAMGNYGYSAHQLMQVVDEYSQVMVQRNERFDKSESEMADDINKLLITNNAMASIMGKTRDEQLRAATEQSRDPNFQVYKASKNYTVDQDNMLNQTLGGFAGSGIDKILKDMLMFNGAVQGDAAKLFSRMDTASQDAVTKIYKMLDTGTASIDAINDQMQVMKKASLAIKDQQGDMLGMIGTRDDITSQYNQMLVAAGNFKDLQGQDTKKAGDKEGEKKAPLAQGTKVTDEGSLTALGFEQNIVREAQATANAAISELMNSFLKTYGPQLKSMSEGTHDLMHNMRGTIESLGKFETALSMVTTLMAGGAIINAASGLVTTIVAAKMIPQLGGFVRALMAPLGWLASGMTSLGRTLLSSSLSRSIGSALTAGIRSIPALASAEGLVGALGIPMIVGYIGGEIAKVLDDSLSDTLYNNTSDETKQGWYDFRKDGEGFWDFMAQGLNGVIQSGPNAGKNYWTGKQEYKRLNNEWVELSDDEKNGKTPIVEDKRDKWGGYDTYDPNAKPEVAENKTVEPKVNNDINAVNDQTDALTGAINQQTKQLNAKADPIMANGKTTSDDNDDMVTKLGATINQQTEQVEPTVEPIVANVNPTYVDDMVTKLGATINDPSMSLNQMTSLDSTAIVQALNGTGAQTNAALTSVGISLERIYQILKQNYDFDRENGQIMRDRLAELNKNQEEVLRLSRRG